MFLFEQLLILILFPITFIVVNILSCIYIKTLYSYYIKKNRDFTLIEHFILDNKSLIGLIVFRVIYISFDFMHRFGLVFCFEMLSLHLQEPPLQDLLRGDG